MFIEIVDRDGECGVVLWQYKLFSFFSMSTDLVVCTKSPCLDLMFQLVLVQVERRERER